MSGGRSRVSLVRKWVPRSHGASRGLPGNQTAPLGCKAVREKTFEGNVEEVGIGEVSVTVGERIT
jgi:hypothetical protein